MAITTSFEEVKRKFSGLIWRSVDDFEEFFLQDISERLSDTNYYTDREGVQRVIEPVNHYPELKEYQVWLEGYSDTGLSGGASLLGVAKARNFAQACHIVMCGLKLRQIENENAPGNEDYCNPGRWDYDPVRLTYWGSRLYWSRDLAKMAFG